MITQPRPISSACIKCSSPPILWIKDEVLALSESEKFSLKIWNYRKCFVFSFSRSYSNFKLFLLAKPCCSKLLEYDEGRHQTLHLKNCPGDVARTNFIPDSYYWPNLARKKKLEQKSLHNMNYQKIAASRATVSSHDWDSNSR